MASMDFLKKALPWIGSAAAAFATGGPAGLLTVAAKGIGAIVGKNVAPTADSIAAAVAGATPEQLLEMKKLDQDYALQLQQLGYKDVEELADIAAKDRDSARNREIQVKDWTPRILTAAFVGMAGYICYAIMHGHSDVLKDPTSSLTVGAVIGYIFSDVKEIVSYYFGSSAGSDAKTQTLSNIAQNSNKS
jgi:hypothetical protein